MPLPIEAEMARIPMFRRTTSEDRKKLVEVSRLADFARGESLFREGDEPKNFFLVVTGRVKVIKSTPSGRDLILELFGPGDPVGAVAVFEEIPYPGTAVALLATSCLVIRREGFLALLDRNPSLVRGLLSGFSLRLMELTSRLSDLSGAKVEARIAHAISNLAEESGERRPEGLYVPVRLSRQELADLCGTTIETAIRVMSRWNKEGIVRTEPEGFLVLAPEALSDLALG